MIRMITNYRPLTKNARFEYLSRESVWEPPPSNIEASVIWEVVINPPHPLISKERVYLLLISTSLLRRKEIST